MALTEAQKRAKAKYYESHREQILAKDRERKRLIRQRDPEYEKKHRLKYAAYYKAYEQERHKRRYIPKKQGKEYTLKRMLKSDSLPQFERVAARSQDGHSTIERWSVLADGVLSWYMVYCTDDIITMVYTWDIKQVIKFDDDF